MAGSNLAHSGCSLLASPYGMVGKGVSTTPIISPCGETMGTFVYN